MYFFSALQQTHCAHFTSDSEWVTVPFFIASLFKYQFCSVLTVLIGCCMAGAMWNCCHLRACSVYTIEQCGSLHCHFNQSNICRVHVCVTVTCHQHFWQNDRDLLHATVVTLGWDRHRNKSQHRKLTLEKNIVSHSSGDWNPSIFYHKSTTLPCSPQQTTKIMP